MANFNRRDRLPNWVAEHLDIFSLTAGEGVDRSRSAFAADPNIPTMFRAQLKDYIGSGFDRGHQAPAADAVYTQEAMDQTFYLTNMAPQVGIGFNRHCKYFVREFVGLNMPLRSSMLFLRLGVCGRVCQRPSWTVY